jgi:WhiB family redox-sensing transcriptional regulator
MSLFMDGRQRCAETDPEIFFSEESGMRSVYRYERQAKAICNQCDLKSPCLAYAMSDPDLDGIWGGTLPRERAEFRRMRHLMRVVGGAR